MCRHLRTILSLPVFATLAGLLLAPALSAWAQEATQEPDASDDAEAAESQLAVENPVADALAEADALYALRAEGAKDGRAAADPIAKAVAAYEEAFAEAPENLEIAWKLLRAIHYQGDYATDGREAKQAIFERGREVMEATLEHLAERVGGRESLDELPADQFAEHFSEPEVARIYFWGAVNWGLWGEVFSKMKAARQGVAKRLRDYAEIVIALDPGYEDAGGHRLLGRLHTEAPKIPFVTGWINRDTALSSLREAVEIGPEDPYNRFYLADALIKFDKKAHAEALEILRQLETTEPREHKPVPDAYILRQARELLATQ